ncbi:arginine--tRNA ligase [Simkania negevensis]|uniref:Arginine--tRNA ligase n=1 Tax=Simkania negevensis TaxID=83561 RepID=A0ABS3ATL7_9BACT|nr:arginine--tRNA ligase [Simkania negevensis]
MKNIADFLSASFEKALIVAFPDLKERGDPLEVTQSTQDHFGHYQFNSAMRLAKVVKSNPRKIAEALVAKLDFNDDQGNRAIEKVEVAGPGFVNITMAPSFLADKILAALQSSRLGIPLPTTPQKIIVEFSSPNIAKELHVGHLRSTIIGESIARLFEFLGYDVLRLNHVGDWGTPFGMLITFLVENHPGVVEGKEAANLHFLAQWYKEARGLFDTDKAFKERSQRAVVALQAGDAVVKKVWEKVCEISREAFEEVYRILDVTIRERGESFYHDMLADVVAYFEEKGLVTLSDGAKCVFMDGFLNREGDPLPLIIQKSDGGYNYATTDLAAVKHRIETEKAKRVICLTDSGQSLHFQMVFQAAEEAGLYDPQKERLDHVGFGLVLGEDGQKIKTRSGDTVKLIDLLNEAVVRAKAIVKERHPEWGEADVDALARVVGIGALKYSDLATHRTGNYTFSFDRMLRFEGNTAPYLLYSYVRIQGIKRKVGGEAGIDVEKLLQRTKIVLEHPSEVALVIHLLRFAETLQRMANDLLPNRLTDYLYQLAERFNAFFRDCRVEGDALQDSRLLLCEATARTMQKGLHILGLHTSDKM